jgi:hypothetical protein
LSKFNKNSFQLIFQSFRQFKEQFKSEKTANAEDSILLTKLETLEAEFESVY